MCNFLKIAFIITADVISLLHSSLGCFWLLYLTLQSWTHLCMGNQVVSSPPTSVGLCMDHSLFQILT